MLHRLIVAVTFLVFPALMAAQKTVFIPAEWDDRDIPYSMERSYQSDNFILFWGEKAGTDPQTAPEDIRFEPSQTAAILEDVFAFYVNEVNFIPEDHGNFALYKFIIVINETWNPLPDGTEIFKGWAFGGSYESTIGAMWVHPRALGRFTLAHEFTHSMQNMIWIDYPGHGFINNDYVGSFWETHANFMALQANPDMVENTGPARFLSTQHFYWSSARHHYTNWMFLQYILDNDGMELINRLWRESEIGEHPLETLKRLKGIGQNDLNDMFASYAMRNITFDYSNGDEIRYTLENEIDSRHITRRFTIPADISVLNGRYIVPRHRAPQDYGYNIVRLYPDVDNESGIINITFRIHDNYKAGGGGTRTGFVFVTASGTARYSDIYRDGFDAEISLGEGEEELYMVVTGAPGRHHNYSWEPGFPKIYRFPWEMRLEGARPMGYTNDPNEELKDVGGAYHSNGRGFVAFTANVSSTAYVGTKAVVLDNAVVSGNARIEGAAVVRGEAQVTDNAVVSGFARVGGNARLGNDAEISEYARVDQGAVISGNAKVKGSAAVFHSTVTDNATVKDNASMWGATLSGTITVGGDAEHFGACSAGTYLQIFNLQGRGCDGQTNHDLNTDVNPVYTPFTDEEMGLTGLEDIMEKKRPYIMRRTAAGSISFIASGVREGTGIEEIRAIDISGRLLDISQYMPEKTVINLQLNGRGFIILRIKTSEDIFAERIIL